MNRTQKIFLIALLVIGNSNKLAITATQAEAVLACTSAEAIELLDPAARELVSKIQAALDQNDVSGVTLAELLEALAVYDQSFGAAALQSATTAEIVAHIRTQEDHFPVYIQEMFTQLSNEELMLAINEARTWDKLNEFLDFSNEVPPIWPDLIDEITGNLQKTKKPALKKLCTGLKALRNKSGLFGVGLPLKKLFPFLPEKQKEQITAIGEEKGWVALVARVRHT